jgi:hypothetical protein
MGAKQDLQNLQDLQDLQNLLDSFIDPSLT